MKAADLAVLVFALVLVGGGFGAFYYWQQQEARAAEAAYEADLDATIDRKIGAVRLDVVTEALASQTGDRLAALDALYADPRQNDQINLGFGTLRGDFPATYALVAEQHEREVEPGRFQRELDERFGEGAYQLMSTRYDEFLANAHVRAAQLAAEEEARMDMLMRGLRDFERRNGRAPASGARFEDGRVVED